MPFIVNSTKPATMNMAMLVTRIQTGAMPNQMVMPDTSVRHVKMLINWKILTNWSRDRIGYVIPRAEY